MELTSETSVFLLGIATIASPVIVIWATGRTARAQKRQEAEDRRAEKAEDWKREDEVAKRAADAALALLESSKDIAVKVEKSASATDGKLDQIHTLVNSNMTQALQSELNATMRELVLMREVVDMKRDAANGHGPTPAVLAEIAVTESKISELQASLFDRHEQQKIADAQAKAADKRTP